MDEKEILEIRKQFPIFKQKMHGRPLIYFDSAATTQKPKRMIESLTSFYANEYATVHRGVYELSMKATDKYNASRETVKKFINANSEKEIVFTKGTTESINLVAYSYGDSNISQGDEIIISEMEHHSNLVPWQMLCRRKKAKLKVIRMNDHGELVMGDLQRHLSENTKLVCVAHVANSTGTVNPIKEIINKAHKFGAKVLVDGAQASAHIKIDVQELDADFYAFSSHKMYGPNGVGILYGKKTILDAMPPFQGGGDMIDHVTMEKTTYQHTPLRFEAGTPTIAEIIAFEKSLDFIEEIGLKNIASWEKLLLNYATEKIQNLSQIRIIGTAKEKGAIVSFIVDDEHPLDIGTFLDLEGIAVRTGHHCAQPTMAHFNIPGTIRASFGIYNLFSEIDGFIEALNRIVKKLQ